ncbi:MAG TPA: hypothetical protein VMS40_07765 [Vicinamibacterales bacterium]|nr:hypothetical protein [Vicinamibacterales bacterium]
MKPWELIGETRTPDGSLLTLTRHVSEIVIMMNGKTLMSNRVHGSEEAMAAMICPHLKGLDDAHVLIGGLGMGFTLRATLDLLPPAAIVTVAELIPAVVEWNRGPLGPLANHPLKDPRVRIEVHDVAAVLRANYAEKRRPFDAIMLDVDNGPAAFTSENNGGLYTNQGIADARRALSPRGVMAIWSAFDDRKFVQRLSYAGFDVRVEHVRARLKKGGPRHTIFLAYPGGAPAKPSKAAARSHESVR